MALGGWPWLPACALAAAGCLGPDAVQCPGGGVCPQGFECFTLTGGDEVCIRPDCGDGVLQSGETCDDGNHVDGDGCTFDCRAPCGDGVVDLGEACDDGNHVGGDGCAADCSSSETCGNGVLDADEGEACDDGNLRNHDGCTSTCGPETRAWRDTSLVPAPRRGSALAYDAGRGRIVMFGGCLLHGGACNGGFADDTWEWDGTRWIPRASPLAPLARMSAAMAYDHARRRVVLFGGCNDINAGLSCSGKLGDTWEWDGAAWTRRDVPAPSPRTDHAMAYDAARARIVLFGGSIGAGMVADDTWEWDGTAWTQRTPSARPSLRFEHAMTYDAARGRVVLFGGRAFGGVLDDTWEWDGTTWSQRPTPAAPPARGRHAMTYAAAPARVVVVGGCSELDLAPAALCLDQLDDQWAWDGTTWTETSAAVHPAARSGHALAYDPARDRVVLFGGDDGTAVSGEIWEWSAGAWSLGAPRPQPAPRMVTHMAYDAARAVVVLSGGDGGTDPPDTWEWNGAWTQRSTPVAPPWRRGSALTYDPARGEVVEFGGRSATGPLADTWIWNGTAWSPRSPAAPPAGRYDHAMTYDPVHGRTLMYGGTTEMKLDTDSKELWSWDGASWRLDDFGTGPQRRHLAAMAYDGARGRAIVYGGIDSLDEASTELWEWEGATWTLAFPATAPIGRAAHAMTYDPLRKRTVMFGGEGSDDVVPIVFDDTWEWDGATWSIVDTAGRPPPSQLHALAYDVVRGEVVLFGGGLPDTWTLTSEALGADERCTTGFDGDGDGLLACDDPDCAGRCDPLCAAHGICDGDRPRCGDGRCSALESCRLCPADCGACAPICGDFLCDPDESCTTCGSDCPCP